MRPGVLSCFIALSHSCLACSLACLVLSEAASLTPFFSLALRSRHEPDHVARARTHTCVQWEMPSVRQYQFVETYFYLPFRGEVCVQRSDFALAGGDRLDFGDLAGHLRSDGHDKAVKRVYRPYDDCENRLAHIFYTRLLLQSYLQWCALGHREVNGLERRR